MRQSRFVPDSDLTVLTGDGRCYRDKSSQGSQAGSARRTLALSDERLITNHKTPSSPERLGVEAHLSSGGSGIERLLFDASILRHARHKPVVRNNDSTVCPVCMDLPSARNLPCLPEVYEDE